MFERHFITERIAVVQKKVKLLEAVQFIDP